MIEATAWAIRQARKINESSEAHDHYGCRRCNGRGYIAYAAGDTVKMRNCMCVEGISTRQNIKDSGMKNLLDVCTFETYVITEPWQQQVYDLAVAFSERPEGWFFFGGQSGTGKTHICVAIADRLFKSGCTTRYMRWRDDAPRLKALVNDREYTPEVRKFQTVECLYIDDFWKGDEVNGEVKAADIKLAFQILDYRYSNKLVTIISSEMTLPGIIRVDEAMGGRIREMCGGNSVSMSPDRQRNQRNRREK